MPRRIACAAGALAALLACAAPANAAPQPRIINGSPASQGEYPAQGGLFYGSSLICGGTLISNRHFLTAAHCVTTVDGDDVPTSLFSVRLGSVDNDEGDHHTFSAKVVHPDYDAETAESDAALLTLSTPASAAHEPLRVIEDDETALWADGDVATVIGWGRDENGAFPDKLREATVPMRSDAYCDEIWGTAFFSSTMVCAGGGATDTCNGDSGGPLMVSDGAFLVLAGLTSWGADPCAEQDVPGVYTRLGAPDLNAWVRGRVPMARASVSEPAVDPGEPVTFSVSASHPGVPGYFTGFTWDFDSDGAPDGTGASVTHTYPDAANYVARVVASGAGADTATNKVAVKVGDPTPPPEPTPDPTPVPSVDPTPEPSAEPTVAPGPQPAAVTQSGPPLASSAPAPRFAPRRAGHWPRSSRPAGRRSAVGASSSACGSRAARPRAPR